MTLESLPLKKNLKEKILEGAVFSESKVSSSSANNQKYQELQFQIAGLHSKSCAYALKKLSLYESYHLFLNFVKESHYNEEKKEINFLLSHALLPYDMRLIFNLPRIVAPGSYPFSFDIGILKDLRGTIYVTEQKKLGSGRCFFYTEASWKGPHTGFPDIIFELFSQTLSKFSMERLFRLSSTLSH